MSVGPKSEPKGMVRYQGRTYDLSWGLVRIEKEKARADEQQDAINWQKYEDEMAARREAEKKLRALKDKIKPHKYHWNDWPSEVSFKKKQTRYADLSPQGPLALVEHDPEAQAIIKTAFNDFLCFRAPWKLAAFRKMFMPSADLTDKQVAQAKRLY